MANLLNNVLRGINLGGKHRVPMKDLAALFTASWPQVDAAGTSAEPPRWAALFEAAGGRVGEEFTEVGARWRHAFDPDGNIFCLMAAASS